MSRRRRLLRRLRVPVAIACAAGFVVNLAGLAAPDRAPSAAGVQDRPLLEPAVFEPRDRDLIREGRRLFVEGCSSCHGEDARGIRGRAPSLHGAGELSADFYLRTNRMPLDDPEDQPSRHPDSPYTVRQKRALVAWVGTLGGPSIPHVAPEQGNVAEGQQLFTEHCAGCHQVVARGGIMSQGTAPDLEDVAPIDVAEALEIGPYVMSKFGHLDDDEVNSIARYVQYAQDPEDRGGWGVGHIGPIPEGMVTWFLGMTALLLTIRVIGERTSE